MLIYLFKSMVCLSLLFGLYKLALGRTTFFCANHLALLFCTLLSVVAPFVEIPVEQEVPAVGYVDDMMLFAGYVSAAEGTAQAAPVFIWQNILTLIYIIGAVWCMGNILVSAVRIFLFIKRTPAFRREKGYTLLLTDDESVAPYSLGCYVVMSRADFNQNGEAILAHELCHVRNYHTVSVMLMNLLSAALWINPIVWLVREELLLVCEYEADTAVISKGIDAKQYQLLLIKKAVSPSRYTIANSLNHSSLKKRITMMRKSKSNSWARLNYCLLALGAAVVLPAFAHKDLISPIEETLKENLVETISETAVGRELKSVARDFKSVINVLESEIGGKGTEISVTEQIEAQKIVEIAPEDSIHYYATMTYDEKERQEAKQVITTTKVVRLNQGENPPEPEIISYRFPSDKKPLVLLDSKEVNIEDVNKEDIASIKVLKDGEELKPYGEKGKSGVILITSRKLGEAYSVSEKLPEFEGGTMALMQNIVQNIKYPEKAVKEQKEGRVIVQFIVTKTGAVEDVHVVRGVMPELDAEAIRVVQNTSGHWAPGKNKDGEAVNCKYMLPVSFKLQ